MTTTKSIRINANNTAKLIAAIEAAEGKASVRRLTADLVHTYVQHIEKMLSTRMYKKDWTWLIFTIDPHAQSFPGAYKGTPESTLFSLERTANGWFVTHIRRCTCRGPQSRIVCHNMAEKAEALVKFAKENW